jgi:hypothetical protein
MSVEAGYDKQTRWGRKEFARGGVRWTVRVFSILGSRDLRASDYLKIYWSLAFQLDFPCTRRTTGYIYELKTHGAIFLHKEKSRCHCSFTVQHLIVIFGLIVYVQSLRSLSNHFIYPVTLQLLCCCLITYSSYYQSTTKIKVFSSMNVLMPCVFLKANLTLNFLILCTVIQFRNI